jgi:hypothetical protein
MMEATAVGNRDDGRRVSRLIGGALLVLVGSLLVLQNAGVLEAGNFGDYWPLLLVWVGATRLFGPNRSGHFVSGAVLLVVGVFFQVDRLGWLGVPTADLWPALLVAVGAALILEGVRGKHAVPAAGPPGASDPGGRS